MTICIATYRESGRELKEPGDFCYFIRDLDPDHVVGLVFACPCGCGEISSLPFGSGEGNTWHWDGDREHPSLWPVVQRCGDCRWTGIMDAGIWTPQPKGVN